MNDAEKEIIKKLPFRKYMRPWSVPYLETILWWIGVFLALVYGTFVGLETSRIGKSVTQFTDQASYTLYDEARYWAHGGIIPKDVYGAGNNGACGLWSWTHHPPGATYITALWMYMGYPGQWAQIDVLAVSTTLVLVLLAWRNPLGSMTVGSAILVLLYYARGYNAYLALPYEDTWFITCMYLLAAACMLSRPLWPTACVTAVAAATCIAMTPFHMAIIASMLFAVHGIGWTTIKTAYVAISAWGAVFLMHLIQVWCHFGWSAQAVWDDYMTGTTARGGATSLLFRITAMPFAARINELSTWSLAYLREVVEGKFWPWTDPIIWFLLLLCALGMRLTCRGFCASIVFVGMVFGGFLLAPGLLPPHMHSLPRIILMIPIGILIVCAARPVSIARVGMGSTGDREPS